MSELQTSRLSANGTAEFSLCTFCNNSTNRFEKRLFATAQPKGPFFPILAELQGKGNKLDALGRAVVCVACFHHLLRQWSSFERRGVPIRKREYNIITEDRVTNYQTRREEEIRKEAELQIKEIQDREEKIRLEAEERFGNYQKRQADIRREAEKRLLEEQKTQSEFERDTSLKLKQEQEREDKLRRQAEGRIQEEKEKRDYIRQEAERLLREEKLIEAKGINSLSAASPNPQVVTKFRTEVIIQPPATKAKEQPVHSEASQSVSVLKEATVQTETAEDMESFPDDYERKTRTQRKKMMVYDPETGCYRKGNDDDDDKENFFQETKKTEKVEYRFRLRSDEKPWKHTEASDSCSRPDLESEDITMPMEPVQYAEKDVLVHTEKTIMLNGKEKSERKGSKDGDISDKDIKVAGDVIKARFDEGRERFEQEPFETRTTSGSDYDEGQQRGSRSGSIGQYTRKRTVSDDSLEDKIKEMEKRRERLLQRGSSGTNILQGKELEVKPVEGEEPSPVPVNPRDGAMSPVEDTKKRQRSRQERNKRRLTAEELSLRKSIGDEEDTAKVTKTEKEEPKKRQEETTAWSVRPIGFDKREEEVFLKKEEPVEASNDLMTWEDVTDGPKIKDISSLRELPTPEFKDDTKSRSQKLVEIDLPIPVTRKEKEDNSTVTTEVLLDLDEDSTVSTTTTIESFSNLENRRRMGSNMDEDRRLREKEHEERKRRIEENQRRGAEELKAKKQQKDEVEPKDDDGTRETDRLSMKEKRRSLVDLWESFSETQPQVISFSENEIEPAKPIGNISTHETKTMVINPVQDNYETKDMEVDEDDNFDTRPSLVGYDVNHKLSEEERRWETAGNFQPGRLQKTVFHSLVETAPTEEQRPSGQPRKGSRYDWMKTESTADQAALVPSKLKLDWNSQEVTDVKPSSAPVIESSPERSLWVNKIENGEQKPGSESDSESSSDEERAPRVDVDEVHKLTEDEKQWESAGQFQPRKLNSALLAGFQQGPNEEVHKSAPRKGQGKPYEMLKKMHQTLSKQELLVPTKLTVKKTETSGESSDIRPVEEARTEAAPHESTDSFLEGESDEGSEVHGWMRVGERSRRQRQEKESARLAESHPWAQAGAEKKLQQKTDLFEDKFEAKIRTKQIRKISPSLLFQFIREPEKTIDGRILREKSGEIITESRLNENTEFVPSFEKVVEESERCQQDEDQYEQKVRNGQIRKLNLRDNPFLQNETRLQRSFTFDSGSEVEDDVYSEIEESQTSQEMLLGFDDEPIRYESSTQKHSAESESDSDDGVPEWRKVEERRRHQEQEEIERARQEERRRQELQPVYIEAVEESAPVDDEFEAKVRTKEIRKINPNLLFQFMSQSSKNEEATVSKDESHTVEAVSREEVLLEENSLKDLEDVDDEFEQKVKNRQVKKLVLDNSPFLLQTTEVENRVVQKQSPTESAQVSRTVHVWDDVVVQRVDGEVVETQPAINYFDAPEDEGFEVRIRAKDVKRLNKDQFDFLRREEEEAHRRLKEEEHRQVEREEREMRRREEEQRRRLQAQVEAEEKEKVRLEEERRRREEQERNRREEQQRLRFEEAERLREEEEERLRREEEMEQLAREEMRKQKQAAQRKFQSGVFEDDDGVQWKNKETTSVGRLNLNMFATFQKASPDDAEPKARTHGKEQKMKEELKAPKVESETVVVQSVDVIESSPSTDAVEDSRREELEYEEKRKSVGKLDPAWYLKQQELQAAENKKRARELELERMKEEQYEIVKMKQETSLQEGDSATVTTEIENRRGKLSVDHLLKFQRETKEVPKRAKELQEQLITIESRDDVESIPQEIKYNEKRASRSYDDDQNYVILGRDSAAETQRNLRLQKEREEMDSFLLEEENEVGDKPKNVGKLDRDKLSLFQQESQDVVIPRRQELEKERKVQEVVIVQRQEQVESVPDETLVREEYHRSPTLTEEEMEYEQGIKSAKTLDVQKFLQSRNQEALEREQRKRQLAEDRTRQEKEEMLKLKEEEERKQVRSEREEEARKFSAGVGSLQRAESDSESSRSFLLSKNDSRTLESEQDSRDDRKISVGRLPKDLRSTFEGKGHVEVVNTRPQKKIGRSSSKYSIELSESSSGQKERYVAREGDINGNLTFEEKEVLEETPSIRKGSMKEAQYHDQVIASSTSEEKPVPKRLDLSMFTAFEQTDKQPVSLRRAKSEKQVRPKSVGNVDLLIWQDDAIINQPSAQRRKKESTERQPRPKSIAF